MKESELKEISFETPFSFNVIIKVHDMLPSSYQNRDFIFKIIHTSLSTHLDIKDVTKDLINVINAH